MDKTRVRAGSRAAMAAGNRFPCAECGKEKDTDEARMLRGGGAVCESCAERHNYVSCDCCGFYFRFAELSLACSNCLRAERRIF